MTAFSNWAVTFWPILLVIGAALLICAWRINEGSSFARTSARVLILVNLLVIGANAIYVFSAQQQFGPPLPVTMFPGLLGNVIQTGMVIGGAVFWLGFTAIVWYLLGDDGRMAAKDLGEEKLAGTD